MKKFILFSTGKALGRDFTIENLKELGFSSIFIGIGAQKGKSFKFDSDMDKDNLKNMFYAVDFLKNIYEGKKIDVGNTVVVLGGGFTAVDSARTAKRLGAEKVYIAYRRTREEMPVTKEEIEETEAEGIKIMYLVSPKSVAVKDGYVTGIKMINQVLGEKDVSQRRKPEDVEASEFVIRCSTVITALGQKPDTGVIKGIKTDREGMVVVNKDTGMTNIESVYAGGDATGVETVVSAIAEGKRCACSIDKYIAKENALLEYDQDYPAVSKEDVLKRNGYFKDVDGMNLYIMDGKERAKTFSAYVRTMTEEEAVTEASRCLSCGCGEGCALCESICSEFAISIKSPDILEIDPEKCVGCGMCYNRCPNNNIEMVEIKDV